MTDPNLTLALREEAPQDTVMRMNWRDLLFLHFPAEPERIQKHLPPGLTVDTYPDATGKEMAWVGLVPFRMESVRPIGFPRFKPCSDFAETNVRTYCHVDGKDPGVWFFSLDAANPAACAFARLTFNLNYRAAVMKVARVKDDLAYESRRWRGLPAVTSVTCSVAEELGEARAGSLEFFLVERYCLYSTKKGDLFRARVFHKPYQLRAVEDYGAKTGLFEVNGILPEPFTHAVFSEGVNVRGGPLQKL